MTLDELWTTDGLLVKCNNGAVVLRYPVVVERLETNSSDEDSEALRQAGLVEFSMRLGVECAHLRLPVLGEVFVEGPGNIMRRSEPNGVQAAIGWSPKWVHQVAQWSDGTSRLFVNTYNDLAEDEGLLWMTEGGLLVITGKSQSGVLRSIRALTSDGFGHGLPKTRSFVIRSETGAQAMTVDGAPAQHDQSAQHHPICLVRVFSAMDVDLDHAGTRVETDVQLRMSRKLAHLEEVLRLVARIGLESSHATFPVAFTDKEVPRPTALQLDLCVLPGVQRSQVRLVGNRLEVLAESDGIFRRMLSDITASWFDTPADVELADWRGKLSALSSPAPDIRQRAKLEAMLTHLRAQGLCVRSVEAPRHLEKAVSPWCKSENVPLRIPSEPYLFEEMWKGESEWRLVESNLTEDLTNLIGRIDNGSDQRWSRESARTSDKFSIEVEVFTTVPKNVFDRDTARFVASFRQRQSIPHVGIEDTPIKFTYRNVTKAGLAWFLADVLPALQGMQGVSTVDISARRLPVSDETLGLPQRFLQEFYPVDAIVERETTLSRDAVTLSLHEGSGAMYTVTARDEAGRVVRQWQWESLTESRPYRPTDGSPLVIVPAAGYRIWVLHKGERSSVACRTVPTVYTQFWDWYQQETIAKVVTAPQHHVGPTAISKLEVEVWIDGTQEANGVYEEGASWPESLHEDLYFYTLDMLQRHGVSVGDPVWTKPGLIVPWVHIAEGLPHAQVKVSTYRRDVISVQFQSGRTESVDVSAISIDVSPGDINTVAYLDGAWVVVMEGASHPSVEQAVAWLNTALTDSTDGAMEEHPSDPPASPIAADARRVRMLQNNDVIAWLNARRDSLPGNYWVIDRSFQGRPIVGVELYEPLPGLTSRSKHALFKPTLLVLARHHANEVSSTNSAIHLIEHVMDYPEVLHAMNLVIVPVHNTDGAALHRRLAEEHPFWKHHAARFNACGYEFSQDYFDPGSPFGESRVAKRIWDLWKPDIILDDHGIPSHEWVQPFSGYHSPPSFPSSYWIPHAQMYTIWREPDAGPSDQGQRQDEFIRHVSHALHADPAIQARNTEFFERYMKWGHAFSPDKFPVSTVEGVITYRVKVKSSSDSTSFIGRYPNLVTADIVTEVNDETVHGEALFEVVHAHDRAHDGIISWISKRPVKLARTRSSDPHSTRIGWSRKRPLS